jgi:mono/diheme cytochrome c family protein
VLVGLGLFLAVLVSAAWATVELRWKRRFDAPYPPVVASADPAVIAHGQYLVYSAAACAYCHVPREQWPALDRGERLSLTGDHLFRLPFGRIYSSNLTPDPATGIGTRTDAELARVLRYGVRADGRVAFPLMEFQLSDEDLVAVVSYLKSQPAHVRAVPDHEFSQFGKALMAFAIAPASLATPPIVGAPKVQRSSVARISPRRSHPARRAIPTAVQMGLLSVQHSQGANKWKWPRIPITYTSRRILRPTPNPVRSVAGRRIHS